ncbi:MAG: TVP38/TMEM64 family protein [Pseudomonadales bacterium]|nr:TVP38/TMEM64 family protein [Pseudomonadales bacterium]MCP5185491.1 TVP38/TMEM64 family protein [Pseudomonadales bacterium]
MQRALVFVLLVGGLVAMAAVLPVAGWLEEFLSWVAANRAVSWLAFIVAYVLACVFLVPGSLLTLGAGFVFGLPAGLAIVSAASTLGACAAFLIGRYLVRDWVELRLTALPRFARVDRAVGERGALIVLLTRLSPLFPFNLLNYGLGLTSVRFSHYAVASWLGMLPGTALYVYLGSAGQTLAGVMTGTTSTTPLTQTFFVGGLLATLVLTVMVARVAGRALNSALEQA